jgi:hypothetical protein
MDETSWKLLNEGFLTVARRGADKVNCYFAGDPKKCTTAIAAIDRAGTKGNMPWENRKMSSTCQKHGASRICDRQG